MQHAPIPLRIFVAVRVTPPDALRVVLRRLRELGRSVRGVAPENLHVTLRFLGDTEASAIPAITRSIEAAVDGPAPSELKLVGLGVFPDRRRPKVVWAGLADADWLCRMAERLSIGLSTLGVEPEVGPWRPHLTVARIKSRPPPELHCLLEEHAEAEHGSSPVRAVDLMRSDLRPKGPAYSVLASAPLKGA